MPGLGAGVGLAVLLVATAVLYLWELGASRWANSFYAAAVQAGSANATAMLFGSSDAANAITVDKTPAALWVMDLSARLFGFNPWSILVPQALMGVAAVALIHASVRRVAGPGAGLLAGAILASTPVAALMFRFDNPDALLVLLLVAAAYCTLRGCEKEASRWWLLAAGVAVGFGFLAKMLQALLVLPALAAAYLLAAHRPLKRRVVDTLAATGAVIASAGWYVVLVALWPASARPYIGGSQHNSIVELALGYNGFGRLTGDEPGGLGNLNHDVGWGRLFGFGMGADIGWLLPAAVVCIAAGLVITRRAPRTDPLRAALVLWGGWLIVTAAVFSYMNGIVHPYYTVALAPAVAAGVGIGATLLWRNRFDVRAAATLAATVVVTVILAAVLLSRTADWLPWLRPTVAVGGVGAASAHRGRGPPRPVRGTRRRRAGRGVVSGRAGGVHAGHRGHPAQRRDPVGRPVAQRRFQRRRLAQFAVATPRPDPVAVHRCRRIHLGCSGGRVEQRGRIPTGRRGAGDGGRRIQRDRPVTDPRTVHRIRRRTPDPLLHRGPGDDDGPTERRLLAGIGRHREVGRRAFRSADHRRHGRLRPHLRGRDLTARA